MSVSNNSTDILSLDGTRLNNHETLASLEHIQDLLIIKGLDTSLLLKNPHILNKINKLHTTMLNQLPSRNLQLDFSNPYNLIIIVNDSVPIHIGDSLDLDTKLENLTHFLDHTKLRFTNISYFDLRKKNSVIIKKQLN